MSTVQSYDLAVDEDRRRRLEQEQERMRREREQLEVERRRLQAQIEAEQRARTERRTQNETEARQTIKELSNRRDKLSASQAELNKKQVSIEGRQSETEAQLRDLQRRSQQVKQDIDCASSEARAQGQRAEQLSQDVRAAGDQLASNRQQATNVAATTERATEENLKTANILSDAECETMELVQRQSKLEDEISQLDRELRFIDQSEDHKAAAMITLLAMRDNGYSLKQVETEGELISYFEKEAENDERHYIGVRAGPVNRQTKGTERWALLAETFTTIGDEFANVGDRCLRELRSFDTAVKVADFGKLIRGSERIYPKDDDGGVLKPPVSSAAHMQMQSRPQQQRETQYE